MKISAVAFSRNYSNLNNKKQNPNFQGLYKNVGRSSTSYDYKGSPSGCAGCDHYVGNDSSKEYIYYPFADESEEQIQKVLDQGNYYHVHDPEMTGGYGGSDSCTTTRGKTLPFTEKEWNRYPEHLKVKFMKIL